MFHLRPETNTIYKRNSTFSSPRAYKMLRKGLPKCITVYLVAAILLAFHLTQTQASVLRKTERRRGQKEVTETASGIREGIIVFGKASKNASLDDAASYQADFSGFRKGKVFDMKEAQWKRMSPSLLCGSDQMRFRAVGSPVKFLALDQHPPMPLSHVPSSCGYNMQSNPFGLIMNVPFHGCYVVQEDAYYSLPLLWNNIPVTLKCPKTQDGFTTAAPQVPVFPSPFMYPWHMPKPQEPTTAAPQDPALPQGHLGFLQLWTQLLQNQEQSTTATPPHDPSSWMFYFYLQQLLQNQEQSTTATPSHDPSSWNFYLYLQQLLQNQEQSTTATPSHDPSSWNFYLYLQQLLQNQDLSSTAAPPQDTTASPQDPTFWHYLYLQQLLQNQDLSNTAAPLQDSAFWNACLYLQQLLQNQYQSTTAPQDPVPHMPHYMHPRYRYHLNKPQYKAKEPSTSTPNDDQNHLASLFQSLYKHPWLYGLPNASPPASDQSKPGSYDFNSYLYPFYSGQVSNGAPATASPPYDYSWYSQSVNMPWWHQRNVPAAEPTNTPSYTPSHYGQVPGWYHAQHATAAPTTKAPRQMFNPHG